LTLPPLAIGMGLYLPPSVQYPIVIGAVMGYLVQKILAGRGDAEREEAHNRGTLFASGLIVGESLMGVILAGVIVVSVTNGGGDTPLALKEFSAYADPLGLLTFVAMVGIFAYTVLKRPQ